MEEEVGSATKIKYIMDINCLTLEAMAKKLNMSLNTVWRWTAGKAEPSKLAKEKIESIFGKYWG